MIAGLVGLTHIVRQNWHTSRSLHTFTVVFVSIGSVVTPVLGFYIHYSQLIAVIDYVVGESNAVKTINRIRSKRGPRNTITKIILVLLLAYLLLLLLAGFVAGVLLMVSLVLTVYLDWVLAIVSGRIWGVSELNHILGGFYVLARHLMLLTG